MPCGGVAPGRLEQRLVVPDAHAGGARQQRRHAPEALVQHQLAHAFVVGPQVDALDEDVVVIGVATATAAIRRLAIVALRHRLVHAAAPLFQFIRVEEVLNDDVAMFLIENDLLGADFVTHTFPRVQGTGVAGTVPQCPAMLPYPG